MRLKNRILKTLQSKHRSQYWLATRTGIARQNISRIVNNGQSPSLKTALRIAGALGCKVEDLWSF